MDDFPVFLVYIVWKMSQRLYGAGDGCQSVGFGVYDRCRCNSGGCNGMITVTVHRFYGGP